MIHDDTNWIEFVQAQLTTQKKVGSNMRPAIIRPAIVVTRPKAQADAAVQNIRSQGWPAFSVPLLCITAAKISPCVEAVAMQLAKADWIIFVSPNAVFYANDFIEKNHLTWPCCDYAVIGPASLDALHQLDVPAKQVWHVEQAPYDSHHLIEHWQAQGIVETLSGKNALIFKGNGGQNNLLNFFVSHQVTVFECEVYQRQMQMIPDHLMSWLAADRRHLQSVMWLISSSEAARFLYTFWQKNVSPQVLEQFLQWPILASHEQIKRQLLLLGWQNVYEVTDGKIDLPQLECWFIHTH